MQELIDFLESKPSGSLVDDTEDWSIVIELMAKSWDDFSLIGHADGGMFIDKLDRAEDVTWTPLILSFRIERHGSTGRFGPSKKANIQYWELNLVNRTKGLTPDGYRLVDPPEPVVHTKPLAEQYADLISKQAPHPNLSYSSCGDSVKVNISKVTGLGNTNEKGQKLANLTVDGRRKRFREELKRLLLPAGWQMVRVNEFERECQH